MHDNNPFKAQRVKIVHTYRDLSGHNGTVTTSSQTMQQLTGSAISARIGALFVVNVGNGLLYIEPAGSAGPDSFPVPPGSYYELCGRGDELELAQFYSPSSTTIGIMYREVYQ